MDFCYALNALREGKKVSRSGWNGKGMFLFLVKEGKWNLEVNKEVFNSLPRFFRSSFVCMKTVDDKLVPWLASQTDLLAEDWGIVA